MFLNLLAGFASEWQGKIVKAIDSILVPILIIACSIGAIWAIIVGVKMMKADDKSARDENKARLINIAIAIVAVAVLIGLFYALRSWLDGKSADQVGKDTNLFDEQTGSTHIGANLLNTVSLVKQCASMMFFGC